MGVGAKCLTPHWAFRRLFIYFYKGTCPFGVLAWNHRVLPSSLPCMAYLALFRMLVHGICF